MSKRTAPRPFAASAPQPEAQPSLTLTLRTLRERRANLTTEADQLERSLAASTAAADEAAAAAIAAGHSPSKDDMEREMARRMTQTEMVATMRRAIGKIEKDLADPAHFIVARSQAEPLRQSAEDAIEAEARSIGEFLLARFPNLDRIKLRGLILDLIDMPSTARAAVDAIRAMESEVNGSRPIPLPLLGINFEFLAVRSAVFRAFP